jgi:hypothetical protein
MQIIIENTNAIHIAINRHTDETQILLGMDLFDASGASICPKDRSLHFIKAKPNQQSQQPK